MNQMSEALANAGVQLPAASKRVWLWLRDHPNKAAGEITAATKIASGTVSSSLNRLEIAGKIESKTTYSINGKHSAKTYCAAGETYEEIRPKALRVVDIRPVVPPAEDECLLITDKTTEIIKCGKYDDLKKLAELIRKAGGEVTIFKAVE